MNNNQLIEQKDSLFTRIKNFFKNLFSKKSSNIITNTASTTNTTSNSMNLSQEINKENVLQKEKEASIENVLNIEKEANVENSESKKSEKQEFMELYNNSKKGDVDILSLPPETLKKMCMLLEEEIKLKEKNNEILRAKLNSY